MICGSPAYGTVDEANAAIGVARLHTRDRMGGDIDDMLNRIQNDLFDLGADLCQPEDPKDYPPLRVVEAQVERLEQEIDRLNAELQPLKSFVLSGGTPAAAYLHLARTIARRAERDITALDGDRADQPGRPPLHQPAVRSALRHGALCQRQGAGRMCCGCPGKNR